MNARLLATWLSCLPLLVIAAPPDDPTLKTPDAFPRFAAVEPQDVAATFVVQAGFEMQLIAAEPLVTDPVAMAIDEHGRAFVVEMNDYPYTDAKTHQAWKDNTTDAPIGRIRLLEDADGDGRFDRSTVFADGLSWPSGVACYRGGIFVTATPDVWYLKDTDGDNQADVRQQVFTGFRKYNVQAVMNNPVWGLDNKLYVAGSSNGGSVVAPGASQARPIAARGDFRFDPRTMQLELQAGGARFGNCFDDWGNRFLCNIRNPAIHVVLDNAYLARNPNFAAPTAIVNIAEAGDQMPVYRISPVEPWRELRGRQWSADPSKKVPRSELTGGGVFTSTSGITVYRGDAYPSQYSGQIFVAEVANNVIYRQTLVEDGNTFRAQRADEQVEFVASTDTWFRPVNLVNAPDGTLWVLDMYREFIEHPWSIPDDIHARLDLRSGSNRGRIYRLAPAGFQPKPFEKLAGLADDELVERLRASGSWQRETAQRLLVERGAQNAVPKLAGLVASDNPRAVVHALWTLDALQALKSEQLATALQHDSPYVVEQGIRLAEPRLRGSPMLLSAVLANSQHAHARVRLQVALTLGGIESDAAVATLIKLALSDGRDPWMRTAVCSATPGNVLKTLEGLLGQTPQDLRDVEEVLDAMLQAVAAAGDVDSIVRLLRTANDQPADVGGRRLADFAWCGLINFAKRKGISLLDYFTDDQRAALDSASLIRLAKERLKQTTISPEAQRAAIALLTLSPAEEGVPEIMNYVSRTADHEMAIWALQAVGTYKSPAVTTAIVSQIKAMTPQVREEALGIVLARPERTLALLDAIESGQLPPGLLGLPRKSQLLASQNVQVKTKAEQVLGKVELARGEIIRRYLEGMPPRGDAGRGAELFRKHCANCHRTTGVGIDIGPHMETVRHWDKEKLLTNILDPSRELAPQAMGYSIALNSGVVVTGMIAEETSSSLTIKRAGVASETILREDVSAMSNTGLSLMPNGFEEQLSPEQMADLLEFIDTE